MGNREQKLIEGKIGALERETIYKDEYTNFKAQKESGSTTQTSTGDTTESSTVSTTPENSNLDAVKERMGKIQPYLDSFKKHNGGQKGDDITNQILEAEKRISNLTNGSINKAEMGAEKTKAEVVIPSEDKIEIPVENPLVNEDVLDTQKPEQENTKPETPLEVPKSKAEEKAQKIKIAEEKLAKTRREIELKRKEIQDLIDKRDNKIAEIIKKYRGDEEIPESITPEGAKEPEKIETPTEQIGDVKSSTPNSIEAEQEQIATQTEIEIKKAEIEKRRQEELEKLRERAASSYGSSAENYKKIIEYLKSIDKNSIINIVPDSLNPESLDDRWVEINFKNGDRRVFGSLFYNDKIKSLDDLILLAEENLAENKKRQAETEKGSYTYVADVNLNEINNKYDAELAELGESFENPDITIEDYINAKSLTDFGKQLAKENEQESIEKGKTMARLSFKYLKGEIGPRELIHAEPYGYIRENINDEDAKKYADEESAKWKHIFDRINKR